MPVAWWRFQIAGYLRFAWFLLTNCPEIEVTSKSTCPARPSASIGGASCHDLIPVHVVTPDRKPVGACHAEGVLTLDGKQVNRVTFLSEGNPATITGEDVRSKYTASNTIGRN